jgi:hypothetical protein
MQGAAVTLLPNKHPGTPQPHRAYLYNLNRRKGRKRGRAAACWSQTVTN